MKEYLEKLVEEKVYPGCNYAIIYDDKIEINTIGNKSLIPNVEKNSLDTLYDIASLTKIIVTTTIITKLLQQNKISLEDKVCQYLDRFKYENITLFHLLTHTSGLVSDVNWEVVNNKEELIDFFYNKELVYETGSEILYSDINFILLGFIIEKIYNNTLDKIAKKEVFNPLNMKNTSYLPKNKELCAPTEVTEKRGVVKGIVHDEKTCMLGGVCGAAGVFSNIYDLVNFAKMILNNGIFNGKVFIEKKYIDLWSTPLVKGEIKRSIGFVVGHSRTAGKLCSEQTISHTGFTGTTLVIDRKRKIAFIQLSNRIHPTRKNELLLDKRGPIMDEIVLRFDKIKTGV